MRKHWAVLLMCILCLSAAGCGTKTSLAESDTSIPGKDTIEELGENLQQNENFIETDILDSKNEESSVSIIMVGDVLLHTPLQESGLLDSGEYNYDHFFTHTRDLISEADLAIVNQEVILGGRDLGLSGYPAFNGAFEVGDALVDAGFDVVLHGTNHALDKGKKGVQSCLTYWESTHPEIEVLGIHDSQESQDANIFYYEKDGLTIAILNYTYGTNGIPLPESYMVDLLDEQKVVEDLKEADENADFVIVTPHWGEEYTHVPVASEKHWAEIFLENGVDLVIGTHPHVIQPVEWMENEDGDRMLVYYSLGNYINYTSASGAGVGQRAVGAMARVTITENEEGAFIEDYDVVPLISHMVSGSQEPTVYPLTEYSEELVSENEMSQKDSVFTLEYCEQLCREVFGELSDN